MAPMYGGYVGTVGSPTMVSTPQPLSVGSPTMISRGGIAEFPQTVASAEAMGYQTFGQQGLHTEYVRTGHTHTEYVPVQTVHTEYVNMVQQAPPMEVVEMPMQQYQPVQVQEYVNTVQQIVHVPVREEIATLLPPPPQPEPPMMPEPEPIIVKKEEEVVQRAAPAPPPPQERIVEVPVERIVEVEVERIVYQDRIVEVEKRVEVPVEVQVEKIVYQEVEKIVEVEKHIQVEVQVPVQVPVTVEKRVEVPVPVEKIVEKIVEVPVEKIIYRDVPVPVQMSAERVVVKEVPVPVEVIKEIPVPVEKIVYKEVPFPVQVGTRMETRIGKQQPVGGGMYHTVSLAHSNLYGSQVQHSKRLGLGLVLERDDQTGQIVIKDLVPEFAAAKSGKVDRGDVLLSVDGEPCQSYDLDQIKLLTIGDEGSSVTLDLTRRGSRFQVPLVRLGPNQVPVAPGIDSIYRSDGALYGNGASPGSGLTQSLNNFSIGGAQTSPVSLQPPSGGLYTSPHSPAAFASTSPGAFQSPNVRPF